MLKQQTFTAELYRQDQQSVWIKQAVKKSKRDPHQNQRLLGQANSSQLSRRFPMTQYQSLLVYHSKKNLKLQPQGGHQNITKQPAEFDCQFDSNKLFINLKLRDLENLNSPGSCCFFIKGLPVRSMSLYPDTVITVESLRAFKADFINENDKLYHQIISIANDGGGFIIVAQNAYSNEIKQGLLEEPAKNQEKSIRQIQNWVNMISNKDFLHIDVHRIPLFCSFDEFLDQKHKQFVIRIKIKLRCQKYKRLFCPIAPGDLYKKKTNFLQSHSTNAQNPQKVQKQKNILEFFQQLAKKGHGLSQTVLGSKGSDWPRFKRIIHFFYETNFMNEVPRMKTNESLYAICINNYYREYILKKFEAMFKECKISYDFKFPVPDLQYQLGTLRSPSSSCFNVVILLSLARTYEELINGLKRRLTKDETKTYTITPVTNVMELRYTQNNQQTQQFIHLLQSRHDIKVTNADNWTKLKLDRDHRVQAAECFIFLYLNGHRPICQKVKAPPIAQQNQKDI